MPISPRWSNTARHVIGMRSIDSRIMPKLSSAKIVLPKENEFIKQNHGHQTEFKLHLERVWGVYDDELHPTSLEVDQDPPDGEECEADDYFEKYFLYPPGGELREYEISLPDVDVVFGDEATVGTYAAMETALYSARKQQWWNELKLSDTEWPRLC